MFANVLLASTSSLKATALKKAIELWNKQNSPTSSTSSSSSLPSISLFTPSATVSCFKSGDTQCPMPVGEISARACISRRFSTAPAPKEGTLIVGIENYITSKGVNAPWYDRCLIVLRYKAGTVCDEALSDMEVPEDFEPKGAPDIVDLPILGFKQTVGERIHLQNDDIPAEDWFKGVDDTNPDRETVICAALKRAFQQIANQLQLVSRVPGGQEAKKNPFSSLMQTAKGCQLVGQCMVNQVNAVLGPVGIEKGDPLGEANYLAASSWREGYFVCIVKQEGDETDILGGVLASRLGTKLLVGDKKNLDDTVLMASLPEKCIILCNKLIEDCEQDKNDVLAQNNVLNTCKKLIRSKKTIAIVLSLSENHFVSSSSSSTSLSTMQKRFLENTMEEIKMLVTPHFSMLEEKEESGEPVAKKSKKSVGGAVCFALLTS